MKNCKKCGLEKTGRDCKPCKAAYMREWNAKNPDKVKKSAKKKYENNKNYSKEKNKEWVESNRERSNEIKKAWKKRNREKYLAQQREYALNRYVDNREALLASKKTPEAKKILSEWRKENRGRINKKYLEKYHTNPEEHKKHLARSKTNGAIKSGNLIKPKECSKCGESKRLEAHHEDYNKPLEINWLCKGCHCKLHSKYFKVASETEGVD